MAVHITDKVLALLIVLRPDEIRAAPSDTRRRLAALCKHVAEIAEHPASAPPNVGVLNDLRRGFRAD
jgi:hypothetical protein